MSESLKQLERLVHRLPLRQAAAAYQRCYRLLTRGQRRHADAFYGVRARFYRTFWQDAAEAIGAKLERGQGGFSTIKRDGLWTMVNGDRVMLDDALRIQVARNKLLVASLLADHGYHTPASETFTIGEVGRAMDFFDNSSGTVVVKPNGTGAGRGVTTGLTSRGELAKAILWASLFGSELIVEEQVPGDSYRLLYLDGECIDVVRRDPPRVFGDGQSSISQLIVQENAERLQAKPPVSLSPLLVDLDCRLHLRKHGLSLSSVPRAFLPVPVKHVCNQNAAHENHVVRRQMHPTIIALGSKLVAALGLRLAGVDIMGSNVEDPECSAKELRFVFNEVNSTPGLHHHHLVAEQDDRATVGELVLEASLKPQHWAAVRPRKSDPPRKSKPVTRQKRNAAKPAETKEKKESGQQAASGTPADLLQ